MSFLTVFPDGTVLPSDWQPGQCMCLWCLCIPRPNNAVLRAVLKETRNA